jgi:hypothetical protein
MNKDKEPCVPVLALRALVEKWRERMDYTREWQCANDLAALCDAAEKKNE